MIIGYEGSKVIIQYCHQEKTSYCSFPCYMCIYNRGNKKIDWIDYIIKGSKYE